MDSELGAKFEFNGTTLKVVKGDLYCGCYFYNSGRCDKPNSVIGSCIGSTRKDKESVIYKEIKNNMEERNIKLSLEKAREFYSKGGEFKDLALSAFTEDEILIPKLPKTWEEFCINNPICGGSQFYVAEQHLALMQLHQLRDCYRQGWIPDFSNSYIYKYCIHKVNKDGIKIFEHSTYNGFLSFQTKELAEEFLNNFRDLIVKAGDLI